VISTVADAVQHCTTYVAPIPRRVCSHHLVNIAVALRVQRYKGVTLWEGEVVEDRVRADASPPL